MTKIILTVFRHGVNIENIGHLCKDRHADAFSNHLEQCRQCSAPDFNQSCLSLSTLINSVWWTQWCIRLRTLSNGLKLGLLGATYLEMKFTDFCVYFNAYFACSVFQVVQKQPLIVQGKNLNS